MNSDMNLPADLVAFLAAGQELEFDHDRCAARGVKMVRISDLKLERFPVDGGGDEDPNRDLGGTYLVLAVNLIAKCENYSPEGILLWLPLERRYGAWDSDHTTWEKIAEKPVGYLEASIGGEGYDPPFERMVPWRSHPHSTEATCKPQPVHRL
jgi:hypothetical protein